ncbi:MAG TPA: hypothetical protein PK733_14470 [Clostridiales bacterium]|nr:hypothetical protein [Clostridiales bacterium]
MRERSSKKINNELLHRIDGRKIKYVSLRKGTESGETILGKDGVINVVDGDIVIICNARTVFRHPVENIGLDELMSLAGVNIRYKDEDTGEDLTLIAYYKYHRK